MHCVKQTFHVFLIRDKTPQGRVIYVSRLAWIGLKFVEQKLWFNRNPITFLLFTNGTSDNNVHRPGLGFICFNITRLDLRWLLTRNAFRRLQRSTTLRGHINQLQLLHVRFLIDEQRLTTVIAFCWYKTISWRHDKLSTSDRIIALWTRFTCSWF